MKIRPFAVFGRGILAGVIMASIGWSAALLARRQLEPPLSKPDRGALEDAGFVPAAPAPEVRWVQGPERRIRVVERVEVQVPVEVVRTVEVPFPVEQESPQPCIPPQVGIEGSCDVEIVGQGQDRMARGFWSCRASGPGWEASRGPEVVEGVRLEVSQPEPTVRAWRRSWWVGGVAVGDQVGPRLAVSWQRKKWGVQVGAGLVHGIGDTGFDGESYFPTSETDAVVDVSIGRSW